MSSDKVCFAQVDAYLDTNPKVVKAGSAHATSIFQFLLRRVAMSHSNGTVPIPFIDPEYLARTLFMTCDDARHGTSRAVTADLIKIDESSGLVYIVGWTAEWGRRPKAGAERTQSWRDRKKVKPAESEAIDVTTCDETPSRVTDVTLGDESDVREEKRREENTETGVSSLPLRKLKQKADAITGKWLELAEAAIAEINALARTNYRADSEETLKNCKKLSEADHTVDSIRLVVRSKRDWLAQDHMRHQFKPSVLLRPSNFKRYLEDLEARGKHKQSPQPTNTNVTVVDDFEPMPVFFEKAKAS